MLLAACFGSVGKMQTMDTIRNHCGDHINLFLRQFCSGEVCRQIVSRGLQGRALVLPGDKTAKYIPKEIEQYEGDLCDVASLERFFQVEPGVETVVLHCASRAIAECFGGNGAERTAGCAGQPVTEAARKAPLTGAFVLPACG